MNDKKSKLIKRYREGAEFRSVLKVGHTTVPVVLGFFEVGIAEEVSLFGDEHGHNTYDGDGDICYDCKQPDLPVRNLFSVAERPYYKWRDEKSPGHLIIGCGCEDVGYGIKAQFNPYRAFDIGADGMNKHIEYYDPPYYVRISKTYRHSYVLRVDPDTHLVTPLDVDLGKVLWNWNIYNLRKGIRAAADAAVWESSHDT